MMLTLEKRIAALGIEAQAICEEIEHSQAKVEFALVVVNHTKESMSFAAAGSQLLPGILTDLAEDLADAPVKKRASH